jgi:putative FmdB family regulatory protein
MFYEYNCLDHGPFELRLPVSEYAKAQPCPKCGSISKRIFSDVKATLKNWREHMKPYRDETKPFTQQEYDNVYKGGSLE